MIIAKNIWHFLKYFDYEVNQCIQAIRYQVVFQRQEFRCFLLILQLIRPLLVEILNYTAKQPSFLLGKVKNNTIFNYNTVQSQLFIATEGRTMFAPFIHWDYRHSELKKHSQKGIAKTFCGSYHGRKPLNASNADFAAGSMLNGPCERKR